MIDITEQDKEVQELRRCVKQLADKLNVAIEDLVWLAHGNKDVCRLCRYQFCDDPVNCLTCDEERMYGNFKWALDTRE